jgi:archaellum component FlaC
MDNELSRYDIMSSMASRKKEIEDINTLVADLEKKIKQLLRQKEEVKSLYFLDQILLESLED